MAEVGAAWQAFGEETIYDSRWVRLGLVDVEAPNGQRWDYHVVHLDRIAIALVVDAQDIYLWREAEQIGEPTDPEEAGRVEWVPLSRVTELAQRQELLGAGTLVALLYYLASRAAAEGRATGGRTSARNRRCCRSDLICAASRLACRT